MKSARAQLRHDLVELAVSVFPYCKNTDAFIHEIDTQLRQSKNSQQKVSILQFVYQVCNMFDQKQMQVIRDAATVVNASD